MVSRYTGACLGLLAFAVTIVAGMAVQNPPMVTLSRAIWALVIFCGLGLILGAGAQSVIAEYHRQREQTELPDQDTPGGQTPGAAPGEPDEHVAEPVVEGV